jgi:UDP-N-acetylmuramyl pentapeptide phosphotransferase/UDP-N-acetylglucosamine-1-phosphate transferase
MSQFDFKRLNRTIVIYRVVQFLLLTLLVAMVLVFQSRYGALGKPDHFFKSIVAAILSQAVMFYPIYRLALRDASVELDSSVSGLSDDIMKALRKKRLMGDLWKMSLIIFFVFFIMRAPGAEKAGTPFFQSTAMFSFLLIFLTYFQCFNSSAKKRMKQEN